MNKLVALLFVALILLTGCSSEPELIEANGKEVLESPYINENFEYSTTYTISEENVEENYIIYNITVKVMNPQLQEQQVNLGSVEVTDFEGNTYYPMDNSKVTTINTIDATDSESLDFYIKMPLGQKPCNLYFYDVDGYFLDTVTYNYDQ